MGLFKILKAIVGLGSAGSRSGTAGTSNEDVDVTVEHEPEPDTASEDAVKGTDETEPEVEVDEDEGTESDAAEEPAAETERDDDTGDDTETVQDTITESDDGTAAADEADADEADEADEVPEDLAAAPDESTEVISGIGPSYAERLAEAGVETVADLAAADPADVAERSDLSEKRLSRWVASARGEDE